MQVDLVDNCCTMTKMEEMGLTPPPVAVAMQHGAPPARRRRGRRIGRGRPGWFWVKEAHPAPHGVESRLMLCQCASSGHTQPVNRGMRSCGLQLRPPKLAGAEDPRHRQETARKASQQMWRRAPPLSTCRHRSVVRSSSIRRVNWRCLWSDACPVGHIFSRIC